MKNSNLFLLSTHYCKTSNFKTSFVYDLVSWSQIKIKILKKTHASCSNTQKIAPRSQVSRLATVSQQPSGCGRKFHSLLELINLPSSTLFISTDSVICLNIASSRKTPVTFITKLTSFLSCLSQQCFHITELSSRLSKAWQGSLPRVHALLDVSPTYFDLQAWQTNSYVTPVLRHDPFPSCRSTEHQSCSVSLTTKCLCLPAEKLAIICRKLYWNVPVDSVLRAQNICEIRKLNGLLIGEVTGKKVTGTVKVFKADEQLE